MLRARLRQGIAIALTAAATACGGGGDSGGGGVTPPVDNSPASIELSPSGAQSIASGATTTLSATVRNRSGGTVSGASLTWNSSDQTVATVAGGVITAVKVGSANITATTGTVTSPAVAVTVTPGAAAALVITRQPSGATVGVPLGVQPIVEIRDAAGNKVTSATAAITATIAPGDGTISGAATVSAVSGVATFADIGLIGLAGNKTIAFTAQGLPSVNATPMALAPGAAARLGVSVQPNGAVVAVPFTTQPVIQVQDLGGNPIASASAQVTAAIASGGGTLGGTTSSATVNGVATFGGLTLVGTIGNRTMSFSANGLASATSSAFALAPGAPASMTIGRQPVGGAIGVPLLVQPIIELRDVAGNLATTTATAVAAGVSLGGGFISGASVTSSNGTATFTNLTISGTPGERELIFAATGLPSVNSSRFPLEWIIYGLSQDKLPTIDVGSAVLPASSSAAAPSYVSRAGALASVDGQGRVTALQEGQAWIVAQNASGKDSLLAIVPRASGGPILRTNLRGYTVTTGSTVTADLVIDPRATRVGSVSFFLTATYDSLTFSGTVTAVQPPGANVVVAQPTSNVYRFSMLAPNGISAPTVVGRLTFAAPPAGQVLTINLTMIDANAPDGSDLRGKVTSTYLPLVSK